jgi:hypothetical protein
MQSIPDDFWTWLSSFNGDDLAGMIAAACVCTVVAIGLVCLTVYQIHKSRAEHALKRELLDRGMSADEIATIIRATPPKCMPRGWTKN